MTKYITTILFSALTALAWSVDADACTGLIATKGATTDGSTLATYAADSHQLYGELYMCPASDHAPGAMRDVIDWDTRAYRGQIPQPAHTYARMGNMNEHGLTIVESTWGGRPELEGSGMIDYGSLIYITLERAKNAREALKVMTDLVDKYGYASEGESFTIADADEVWIMELIGKGKADKGAVWVARRVPDGYISGHANHSRIHKFPLKDKNTLYSPDVIKFARQQGYFDGKDEDFDFSRTYAITDGGALRGCDGRVWSYFNRFGNSEETPMSQYLPWILRGEGEVLPLWVEAKKKVSADDLKWMMRDHFEGTPLDMTKDIGAGPFASPYRHRPLTFVVDSVEYTHERAIATQQTAFSLVASMNASRPAAMKGILWFGVDDADFGVYVPIFNSAMHAPAPLAEGIADLYTLNRESLFWANNIVANRAYPRYSQMIEDIRRVQAPLEADMTAAVKEAQSKVAEMPYTEAAAQLQELSDKWADEALRQYQKLGDWLLVRYLDGNIRKVDANGNLARTPEGVPEYPTWGGYDERYFRSIVDETGDHFRVPEIK